MILEDVGAARQPVVAVDILRDDRHRSVGLEVGQGLMGRVGPRVCDQAAPPIVPAPDQLRIGGEGLGRGELLGPVTAPQAVLAAAKGGDAAGGGSAGARKHSHRRAVGDAFARWCQLFGDCHLVPP